jgi:NAD(P) transhydrogenase subunit beta
MEDISYLISAVLFIYGLKMLSHPRTARNGNILASIGMLIAIIATVYFGLKLDFMMIGIAMIIGSIIGVFFAIKVEMTQMPQLVAIFNGFGGAASALVATSEFLKNDGLRLPGIDPSILLIISITLSVLIGTLTFTGSFIAFGKLQGLISTKPITFKGQQLVNAILAIIMFSAAYLLPDY